MAIEGAGICEYELWKSTHRESFISILQLLELRPALTAALRSSLKPTSAAVPLIHQYHVIYHSPALPFSVKLGFADHTWQVEQQSPTTFFAHRRNFTIIAGPSISVSVRQTSSPIHAKMKYIHSEETLEIPEGGTCFMMVLVPAGIDFLALEMLSRSQILGDATARPAGRF